MVYLDFFLPNFCLCILFLDKKNNNNKEFGTSRSQYGKYWFYKEMKYKMLE